MPIQIRRGNLSDLPASAVDGQPLFTEDTHELYFGLGASVVPLTIDAANVNGLPPALPANTPAVTHEFVTAYNSGTGVFTQAQPAYSDISGTPQLAQTFAPVTHEFLTGYNATTGLFSAAQPALGGLSDVSLVSLVTGDILVWNGSAWINELYDPSLDVAWSNLQGTLSNGQVIPYADAGISRLGAASLAIGNGTAGDFTGSLVLANLSISGTLTDSASSAGTSNQVLTVSASTGKPVWAVAAGGGSGNKISRGTNAAFKSSPPATPATGDMYVCSDSPFSYVYDGAAWQAYVFGYNVTEPTPSTVSVIDGSSGGYVQDTSHGGYIIQCPSGSGNCLAILKAIPGSGAYYVDIAFMTYIPGTNGGNGVCLADGTSTSNKLVNSRLGYESSNWPILERQRWNSIDSWNSNVSILSGASNGFLTYGGPLVWFRIYDDGTTNITYYISSNGYVWNQLYQEGRTAWLTPAYAGFILAPATPDTAEDCHLVHLSVHA